MADTHASGACAPSGVRVQIPSFPFITQKDMGFEAHVFSII